MEPKRLTASQLFAVANSLPLTSGEHRCFYCGADCGEEFPAKKHVKDSFSDKDLVAQPGSKFVCGGCVAALQEKADITLITGEQRTKQKTRNYSWVITRENAIAATKSHKSELLEVLLNPPEPPYVICVSDSGQKHFLPHISKVGMSREFVTCNLDGEIVVAKPADIITRRSLCMQVIAVLGRPALDGLLTTTQAMAVMDYHQDESIVDAWNRICGESLTRLALWFVPPKKECAAEYPKTENLTKGETDANVQSVTRTNSRGLQKSFSWTD